MNWNEVKRAAIKAGFQYERHGARHDIYRHPETGKAIQLERHWSQEVRPGLLKALKKVIGF